MRRSGAIRTMSQLWTGQLGDDSSGVAVFTEGDVTAEVPLADVQMFHDLCKVISEARRLGEQLEHDRIYNAMKKAIRP